MRCGCLCICVCSKFPGVCFCQELTKLDDIWLSYNKYKKGDVFLRHSVVSAGLKHSAASALAHSSRVTLAAVVQCMLCWMQSGGVCIIQWDETSHWQAGQLGDEWQACASDWGQVGIFIETSQQVSIAVRTTSIHAYFFTSALSCYNIACLALPAVFLQAPDSKAKITGV